jgi:ATP-binding cassette, subfamily C (CFTR/MRP), member 1
MIWAWLGPLLSVGYSRPLQETDLGELLPRDRANVNSDRLLRALDARRRTGPITKGGFLIALFRGEVFSLAVSALFKLISTLSQFIGPLAIAGIIDYVQRVAAGESPPSWNGLGLGYWWLLALVVSGLGGNTLGLHADMMQMRTALRGRAAVILSIYEKCATVSTTVLHDIGSGKIANMCSSDAMTAALLLYFVHEVCIEK